GLDSDQFFEPGDVSPGHVSAEKAEEIVGNNPMMKSYGTSTPLKNISQMVAENTAKNPSQVGTHPLVHLPKR
ncbi:MAG: hypothetical protein ACREA0_21555, partial [bacterium]